MIIILMLYLPILRGYLQDVDDCRWLEENSLAMSVRLHVH